MRTGLKPVVAFATGIGFVAACGAALADTVPYTEALISTFNPDETVTPVVIHSAPASPSSTTYARSGEWGNVGGSASADLSTGQLKVRATNRPADGVFPYMQSNAWFADGFRTRTPAGPFNWQPNSMARFTLDLHGNSVTASDALANLGFGQVGGFILLSLFQPGTLNPSSKLVGDVNNIAYYLYLLGNPNQHLTYTDPQGVSHQMVPTGGYLNLTQNIHIQQDFQPNGDFDWAVLLGAAGQLTGPQFYDIDLSHTLTLNYNGPEGTTTTAESGLFQNFNVVPEPGTVLLLLCAAALRSRQPTRFET